MATTTNTALLDLLRPERVRANVDSWRWTVRRELVPVRDRLLHERPAGRNAWLSARASRVLQERDSLLARLNHLSGQVLVTPDPVALAGELSRLLGDIDRHTQRLSDLAYDDVELEIGGSE
jgi:hypothetical protein